MSIWQKVKSFFGNAPAQSSSSPTVSPQADARVHATAIRIYQYIEDLYKKAATPPELGKEVGTYGFMVSFRGPTDAVQYNYVVTVSDVGGNDFFDVTPKPPQWKDMHPSEQMVKDFFKAKIAEIRERNARIGR